MASLEDKILGEKTQNYCSSSDSENESNDEVEAEVTSSSNIQHEESLNEPAEWKGVSSNTGPKGVIKDWQRFKQLEIKKRKEEQQERAKIIKKKALTSRTTREDEQVEELEMEFADFFSDEFLRQYRKQRMNEIANRRKLPKFGKLIHLDDGDDFLDAVDDEHKSVTVVVHIYKGKDRSCKQMNNCLFILSQKYVHVKFCKLVGSTAGMSNHFLSEGVPALLVYIGGEMVGNFVKITNDIGDEFYTSDVENFLIEQGMINYTTGMPKNMSQIKANIDDVD